MLSALAANCGYTAVLCPPPFYYRSAPADGLAAFFNRVLGASDLPVLLYHIPQVTGVPIGDDLLDRLVHDDSLAGVKDSTGDPAEMHRLIGRFEGRSYFVGTDRLMSDCLRDGGSGSITAAASVVPRLVVSVKKIGNIQHQF